MTDLVASNSPTIKELLDNIDRYKHNPTNIQRTVFDYLEEVTAGQVDVVDPTNPFVFLTEMSAVMTAFAVNENVINLRKQYPSLAQTEDDLYHHLANVDYINRFSTPAETKFTFVIQVNDLMNKMVYNDQEKAFKATIPRDTKFIIDNLVFTMSYPVDIRKYDNGTVQISYDASIKSPIEDLRTNIIDYVVRDDPDKISWLFFQVDVKQMDIESTTFPLNRGELFNKSINYSDKFYYVRAYTKGNATGEQWKEIDVTYTDQVFDPFKPTIVAKVYSGILNVHIPPVYLNTQTISGIIRFDIHTTKGKITVNLGNYKVGSFQHEFRAIDDERDINVHTVALTKLSIRSFSAETISSGTDGLTFEELRERVIFNSVGPQQIPVSNKQIEAFVENSGFELVKNIDTVTNRVFLATQKLPRPLNPKLVTSANIGINTFITNLQMLQDIDKVKFNQKRTTILSNNIFENINGIIKIMTRLEIEAITNLPKISMINEMNKRKLLFNPFYYVLDDTFEEFELRAYHLDNPNANSLNFISQNQSIQLVVNTDVHFLTKTDSGYRLQLVTKSGNFYKQLENSEVDVQLAFYPEGENSLAYISGTLVGRTDTDERIYEFNIETNYDIDENHKLVITNAKMFDNEDVRTFVDLNKEFHVFYTTNSITPDFTPDEADSMIGKFLLPANSVAVTHETLTLRLGWSLGHLWSRSRSMPAGETYLRYEEDVPLYYDKDIYDTDPITGSIFRIDDQGELVYLKAHSAGDPVLDDEGNQIYKHRKGDVRLDGEGRPIKTTSLSHNKELDMLFVDGRQYFVDDEASTEYNQEFISILNTWITQDVDQIQDILLEQTRIYFFPKTNIGKTRIYLEDGVQTYIDSEQSLTVDLYVKKDVYDSTDIRQSINDLTVRILDEYVGKKIIRLSEIVNVMSLQFRDTVQSLRITGLGGSSNHQYISLADEENRLCLKKILVLQQDNKMIIKEDVTINYHRII